MLFRLSALAKLRLELQTNLDQIDVLDSNKAESTLELFNQRLVIAQNDFLQYLSQVAGGSGDASGEFKLQVVSANKVPELATMVLAGGGAAVLVNLITFSGTSWLFMTTTTSAATLIGGVVGVSAGVATAGIGAAAGLGAGVALNQAMKTKRRKKIKQSILESFDKYVVPQLDSWANDHIAEVMGA
ncbi:hypothetical protein OAU93_00120 [bacterium]|nr:hypothetical protein [bacterium]